MTKFIAFFIIAILSTNTANAMPKAIDGFAGYKFGMTYKQAEKVHIDDKITRCKYKNAYGCLSKTGEFFGYKARIDATINKIKKRIDSVYLNYYQEDNREKKETCLIIVNQLFDRLKASYGKADLVETDKISWFAIEGGTVNLTSSCRTTPFATIEFIESKPL